MRLKKVFEFYQGLRTPNEAFFHCNPELLGLGRLIGQISSGAFGVGIFGKNYEHPFWYSESLAHVFHYSTNISTKELSLYPKYIYLGLGFEFGPQRIRDLAFVCPQSVVQCIMYKGTQSNGINCALRHYATLLLNDCIIINYNV